MFRKSLTATSPYLARSLRPPMCRYARMPVRFHARYAPNHTRTQYPHQQRPRSPPQGYLLTLSVGKVGTRRLGVADRSRSRRGEFRQLAGFRQLRRVPSIARSLHPSRSLMGSTGNPDGISHMCMLPCWRGAGATPTCSLAPAQRSVRDRTLPLTPHVAAACSRAPFVTSSAKPCSAARLLAAVPPGGWVPAQALMAI